MLVGVIHERDADAVGHVMTDVFERLGGAVKLGFEVRLDAMDRPDPGVLADAPAPVVATVRRREDGGSFGGAEPERRDLLDEASRIAPWVDVEWDVHRKWRPSGPAKVLVSSHDFEGIPADLEQRIAYAKSHGAAAFKAAVAATDLGDLAHLADLTLNGGVVAFGLGPVGIPSRWAYRRVGSPWTYARAGSREQLAPGLPHIDDLFAENGPGAAITNPETLFGVLSDRALDSVGPRVFHRVFRRHGTHALYAPVTTPDLLGIQRFLEMYRFDGLSVTTPFKQAIVGFVDEVDALARRVGAVNTVVRAGNRWRGMNTDVVGVTEPVRAVLAEDPTVQADDALVIGTGGAARAAAVALVELGLRVTLAGRNADRAANVARQLDVGAGWPTEPSRVVVNATPAGSARDPDSLPLDEKLVAFGQVVVEMNYHEAETPLTAVARRAGARVVPGRAMYAAQAAAQVRAFGLGDDAAATVPDAVAAELGAWE